MNDSRKRMNDDVNSYVQGDFALDQDVYDVVVKNTVEIQDAFAHLHYRGCPNHQHAIRRRNRGAPHRLSFLKESVFWSW